MNRFVLDASASLSWAFDDEDNPLGREALQRSEHGQACVPAIWWYEQRNGLLTGERRGRLLPGRVDALLQLLAYLPIEVRFDADGAALLALARDYRLSYYDAAYLELAQRLGLPLATLDHRLAEAARAAGVTLL